MPRLPDLIPDAEVLIGMEPEQLAGCLLQMMNSQPKGERRFRLPDLVRDLFDRIDIPAVYPTQHRKAIFRALAQAWSWLEVQGLIVWSDEWNGPTGQRTPSRRGEKLITEAEFAKFLKSAQLPMEFLHSRLRQEVWLLFLGGKFDTAVFQAYKEVEVAVRDAAGLSNREYGVDLIRAAFHPEKGALTDKSAVKAERDALASLFAGAFGYCRNPQAHRDDGVTDAAEARE